MMFAPPPERQATTLCAVPEHLLRDEPTAWASIQRRGAPTRSFLEGPAFDREGRLHCVNIPFGQIFRVTPYGDFEVVLEYDGEPNGLAFHRDGRMFIADHRRGILAATPGCAEVTELVVRHNAERLKGVNDLAFSSNGDLYFTDQGQTGLHDPSGRLFCLAADGRLTLLLDNVPSPNGVALSPDETVLYLAVTRANAVWRVPLLPDGGVSKVGLFVQLSGGLGGPDGLAVDAAGNLFVAHVGLGTVWAFTPLGEPLHRIRSTAGLLTTNLAFGIDHPAMLYVTESESGQILKVEMDVPGLPLFAHS